MENLSIKYFKEKFGRSSVREEIYCTLGAENKRIEIQPRYGVSQCIPLELRRICRDYHFKDAQVPLDLLEGIVADIEKFRGMNVITDPNHDKTVQPRLEDRIRKFRTLVGKQLGYPYLKTKAKS